jgi:hypothetical protein
MKNLIDYDYNMKILKTHWYILVLDPFENIKNPIIIVLSSQNALKGATNVTLH